MGDPPPPSCPGRWARTCASRAAAGPERKWWRKYETLGFPGQCLRFYSYGGYMQAGMDLGPGHKFKLGRNNLAGLIFFRACPKWTKPTEFRAFRAESQIPVTDTLVRNCFVFVGHTKTSHWIFQGIYFPIVVLSNSIFPSTLLHLLPIPFPFPGPA
jgi:hypothetical protein